MDRETELEQLKSAVAGGQVSVRVLERIRELESDEAGQSSNEKENVV